MMSNFNLKKYGHWPVRHENALTVLLEIAI